MKAKGYSVRKGEYNQNASRQPYPGVIIEEMLDSVSVHSGVEHENYPVALIGDHQEEMKPKEPDVSASKIVICFHQSQKYFFRNSFDKKKWKNLWYDISQTIPILEAVVSYKDLG